MDAKMSQVLVQKPYTNEIKDIKIFLKKIYLQKIIISQKNIRNSDKTLFKIGVESCHKNAKINKLFSVPHNIFQRFIPPPLFDSIESFCTESYFKYKCIL